MTVASRQRSEFVTHLHQRLDTLSQLTDQNPEVQAWIGRTRSDLDAYQDGQPLGEVTAVFRLGDHPPARYHLVPEVVGGQLITYVLDSVVPPGVQVQLTDVGVLPVNVRMGIVLDHNGPGHGPRVGRIVFQANVHCPDCGEFGCHTIELPNTDWPGWLKRSCVCGVSWYQYPAKQGAKA